VLALGSILCLIAQMPVRDARRASSPSSRFLGLVGQEALDDNNVYLGLMRQAADGALLFRNNFTPDANEPAMFNLLYLGLGRVARSTGWSLDTVHQLFGGFSIVLLVLGVYALLGQAIRRPGWRLFGLALACGSGGLLWVDRLAKRFAGWDLNPVDPWLVETNLFHAMLVYPHFVFAAALLVGSLALLVRSERTGGVLTAALGGLAGAVLASSHAFEAVALIAVAAAYLAIDAISDRRLPAPGRIRAFAWVALPPGLVLLLHKSILDREPAWGDVVARLEFATPDPLRVAMGLGATFFLVVATFDGLRRGRPAAERLAKAWVIAALALAYVPALNWRWHLLNGLPIPLALLATQGLRRGCAGRLKRALRSRRLAPGVSRAALASAAGVLFVLAALSNVNLFLSYRFEAQNPAPPMFLPEAEVEAFRWMDREVPRDALVLAAYRTGNYLPRMSGQRVVLGEDKLTHEFPTRERMVRSFFAPGLADSERLDILRGLGADYVFHGSAERDLGSYDPGTAGFLRCVYEKDGVRVFGVLPAKGGGVTARAGSQGAGGGP
jgi:hypothetical protein